MPATWGAVARRGARQLSAPSDVGAYDDHRSKAPPSLPAAWVRDEQPVPPATEASSPAGRPRAELPGDVVAAVRTAGASLTNRGREHLVTLTAESVEAYNRGRYQDAARWIRPVAEMAPAVAAIREVAGLANYRAGKWRAALAHLRAHADLTGDVTHLPALMDCERALGHPRKVGWLYDEVRAASPTPEVLSEARIVLAASLSDRGKLDEAIARARRLGRGQEGPQSRGPTRATVVRARRPLRAQRRRPACQGAVHARRTRRPGRLRRGRPARGARWSRRIHATPPEVGVDKATSSPLRAAVTDRFGLVLLSCLVTYSLLISVDSSRWVALAVSLPVAVTVVLSIWASSPGPYLRWPPLVLITAAIVTGLVNASLHGPDPAGVSFLLAGLSLGFCIVAMLARMATHTKVTVRTVLAVLSSYVMLGLFFAYLDAGIGHIMGTFFAQPGAHTGSDYAYLSYITLTTVGFGDLTPGTGVARSVIILEALIGQIFLVTLVARMVSLFGTQRAPFDVQRARKDLEERE